MKKLSIGLLAAVVIAIAAAPADAASKKKAGKSKGKAEVAKVAEPAPVASWGCWLSAIAGSKSPGPGCGR